MSADAPQPYRVDLSARVRARILELADAARDRGDGPAFLDALKEFSYRLRVYPQFGDPLIDLIEQTGHVWIGIILPLFIRYGVFEEKRAVYVAALPVLLAKRSSDLAEPARVSPSAPPALPGTGRRRPT